MGGAREACLFYHKRALLLYAGANPAESRRIQVDPDKSFCQQVLCDAPTNSDLQGMNSMNDSRLRRLRDYKSNSVTLISEGCKISGLITGTGDFLINGEIDGDCDLSGTVTWPGTVYGRAPSRRATSSWPAMSRAISLPKARSRSPKPHASPAQYPPKQSPSPKALSWRAS